MQTISTTIENAIRVAAFMAAQNHYNSRNMRFSNFIANNPISVDGAEITASYQRGTPDVSIVVVLDAYKPSRNVAQLSVPIEKAESGDFEMRL
jgi:hypothetical protein